MNTAPQAPVTRETLHHLTTMVMWHDWNSLTKESLPHLEQWLDPIAQAHGFPDWKSAFDTLTGEFHPTPSLPPPDRPPRNSASSPPRPLR